MFVAADNNGSVVLTESQDTSKALRVTNQEMQEETSPKHLETLEDDRSEMRLFSKNRGLLKINNSCLVQLTVMI